MLLEVLTGRPVFKGETVSHVIASVLKDEPDWTALSATTPAPVRRLLRRCLDKDRKQRLGDAGDARLDLQEAIAEPAEAVSPERRSRSVLPWALVATLAAALGFFGVWSNRPDAPAVRFSISPPDGWTVPTLSSSSGAAAPIAVSPDGRTLALIAKSPDGKDYIWLRA